MATFKFKLAPVETLRKNREQQSLLILSECQRTFQAEVSRKIQLETDLQSALDSRENLGARGNLTQEFALQELYIQGLKQRIIQAENAIFRAKKSVDKAMAVTLECRKKRKAIEKLRERAHDRFKEEELKKERREMDNLSIMRARFSREVA